MSDKMRAGLTLTGDDVQRSIDYDGGKLGLPVEVNDQAWERSLTALDPDGYAVAFAQGRRGHNRT